MAKLYAFFLIALSSLLPLNIFLIYGLALYYSHVKPFFPYLSDSGTTHPEAGYFSFNLIMMSFLGLVGGWYRFKQIRYVCAKDLGEVNANNVDTKKIDSILKLNNYGLYLTIAGNLSVASVAAFRSTEHLILHGMMAGSIFNCSGLNMIIQTWVSYKMIPNVNSLRMARFRLVLTILFIVFLLCAGLAIVVSAVQIMMADVPLFQMLSADRLQWDESYPGYWAHGVSAIFENLAIFIGCPFYLSFLSDANRTKISKGKLTYKFFNCESEAI